MDFIEKIFGIAPDGGSGILEATLFLIPIVLGSFLFLRRRKSARAKDSNEF